LNTLSGSTDIEGIEKTLKAIHASVGYSIALPLHYFKALNTLFVTGDSKVKTGAIKYRISFIDHLLHISESPFAEVK